MQGSGFVFRSRSPTHCLARNTDYNIVVLVSVDIADGNCFTKKVSNSWMSVPNLAGSEASGPRGEEGDKSRKETTRKRNYMTFFSTIQLDRNKSLSNPFFSSASEEKTGIRHRFVET